MGEDLTQPHAYPYIENKAVGGTDYTLNACLDCGLPYREFGLDSTLPDKQWRMIHDREGGLLCANCMVKRASKLPGVIAMRMRIEFANEERD